EQVEPRTILFVGRFDALKGGDIMIDAFARIVRAEPEATLTMVGPDDGFVDADGRRWGGREYLAERHPAVPEPAVRWLGPLPSHQIAPLRRRAAVTLVTSRSETFGYTAAEAMAHGCPLIATAAGGLSELVEDGRTGLLAPPEDPAALAERI